jgi:hypothetical protein
MAGFPGQNCVQSRVWLEDLYRQSRDDHHNTNNSNNKSGNNDEPYKLIATYMGCNKAIDAVNTLRMISSDTVSDKDVWRDRLFCESNCFG